MHRSNVKSGEHDLWDARMHAAPMIADANARLLGIKVAVGGVARCVAAMSASMGRTIRSVERALEGLR